MTQPKAWQTYEEVATDLLNSSAKEFRLKFVEGKQEVQGTSGALWEVLTKLPTDCRAGTVNQVDASLRFKYSATPEEKLDIVRQETAKAKTLYVGDGINDAPAMMAATVGMAIGQNSDVTAEAAGVVVNHCTKLALHPFKSNHHGIPYDLLGISYTVTHLDQYCPVRHSICRFFRA
jgi:hypothetical protein